MNVKLPFEMIALTISVVKWNSRCDTKVFLFLMKTNFLTEYNIHHIHAIFQFQLIGHRKDLHHMLRYYSMK